VPPSLPTIIPLEPIYMIHSSALQNNLYQSGSHFDTHHFVQRLEREGFTRVQSEGVMAAMADVIDESIRNLSQNMVTKAQQEKVRFTVFAVLYSHNTLDRLFAVPLYSEGGLCSTQIRNSPR